MTQITDRHTQEPKTEHPPAKQKKSDRRLDKIMTMDYALNRTHLLILGAPRSGTTLLTSMVGRHDRVALLLEDKRFTFTQIVSKAVVGNKLTIPGQLEFQEHMDKTYYSKYPIERYLDLPNLKMIFIVRHGSDVIASIMKRAQKPYEYASYQWRRAVEIMGELQRRFPGQVRLVSYEDLLKQPEAHMKRICDFLGLTYQPEMREGYQSNPLYPGYSGIETGRARAKRQPSAENQLAADFPETWALYENLRQMGEI